MTAMRHDYERTIMIEMLRLGVPNNAVAKEFSICCSSVSMLKTALAIKPEKHAYAHILRQHLLANKELGEVI